MISKKKEKTKQLILIGWTFFTVRSLHHENSPQWVSIYSFFSEQFLKFQEPLYG